MDFSSERILLAGGGDLGQRVGAILAAAGASVWALRRHPPIAAGGPIHWLRGDLSDPGSLRDLPTRITRLVFSVAPDAREEAAYRAVFVDGLQHLYAAMDRSACRRTVFVSSSAVHGEHAGEWIDEDTPPAPLGFNGRVLLDAERWLLAQDTPATVLRLAGIYGPGRLSLLDRLRAGQARVPRMQPHWANRIHVDDAAAATAHLLMHPAPAALYLGADDTPLPLDQLYDALAALVGAPPPAEGAGPANVGSKRISNARLRESGFVFRWPDAREGYASLVKQQGGNA